MGSVGKDLDHLEKERAIHTDPEETRRRRTIKLQRKDGHSSWGFTLQTYYIRHKKNGQMEVITYVDYVELDGPAFIAGMRRGDVLLSVNGESAEGITLKKLVEKIQKSGDTLWLVVLFEDCCRKVELYQRFIKLKNLLAQKTRELSQLNRQEQVIKEGGRLSRLGSMRGSYRSSTSSAEWDTYSEVASSEVPDTDSVVPNQRVWHRQQFIAGSMDTLDTLSNVSLSNCTSPFESSRESLDTAGSGEPGSDVLIKRRTSSLRVLSSSSTNGDNNSLPLDTQVKAKRVASDSVVALVPTSSVTNGAIAQNSIKAKNGAAAKTGTSANRSADNDAENSSGSDESDDESGACGGEYSLVSTSYPEFHKDDRDTLRRSKRTDSVTQHAEDEEYTPVVSRRRSNSALLNDMRMKLLADDVNKAAVQVKKQGCLEDADVHSENNLCVKQKEEISCGHTDTSEKGDTLGRDCHVETNNAPSDTFAASAQRETSAKQHHKGSLSYLKGAEGSEELDAFDISVVMDDENIICRLYRGVRINDTTEDTRL